MDSKGVSDPRACAIDLRISLSVLSNNQNDVYDTLLREYSNIGCLSERVKTWQELLSVDQTRNKLHSALHATELISEFSTYLEHVDCEMVRLNLQYEHIGRENDWLSEEQQLLRDRLKRLEESRRQLQSDRDVEHLTYKMRQSGSEVTHDRVFSKSDALEEADCLHDLVSVKARGVFTQAVRYIKDGRPDVAIAMCYALLHGTILDDRLCVLDRAIIEYLLSVSLCRKGQVSESLERLEDVLKTIEVHVDADHPSLCVILARLVEGGIELNRFGEAERHLRRLITAKQHSLGPTHREVVKLQADLCGVLTQLGRYEEVIRLSQSCLEYISSSTSMNDRMVIKLRAILARALLNAGNVDTAYSLVCNTMRCSQRSNKAHEEADSITCTEGISQLINQYKSGDRLADDQEVEVLKVLRDICESRGETDAMSQVDSLLATHL